jgi:hypothetical protein
LRFVAIALLALAAACGAPPASAPTTTPLATVSPSPSPTATPSAAATVGFVDVVSAGAGATYRITYVYRVVANGQTQTLQSTWYVRPPEMRWDFASPLGGSSSFYVLKDGVYVCSASGQPTPGCFSLGSLAAAEQSSGAELQETIRAHPDRFTARPSAGRDIAGIAARCFDVTDVSAEFGQGTMCYSADGLPLFTAFSGPSGEFSMEAQSVSTAVSDADFTLPGPVQKLP